MVPWRRSGDKSEPMTVSLLTHTCVTRPHWVDNTLMSRHSGRDFAFTNSISCMKIVVISCATILLKRRVSRAWINNCISKNIIRINYYSMLCNSLVPSDALRRHRTWSTLIQVMVWWSRQQTITCTNVDLSAIKSCGIRQGAISLKLHI